MKLLIIPALLSLLFETNVNRFDSSNIIDGYLVKIDHKDTTFPEYSMTVYYLVPETFFEQKKIKKQRDICKLLEDNGCLKVNDIIHSRSDFDLLISCCEAENIYQGYEDYKAGKFSNNLVISYKNLLINTYEIIHSIEKNVEIKKRTQTYSLSVNRIITKYCLCPNFYGTDPKNFAYLQEIVKFDPATDKELDQIKTRLSKLIK
jgi:hypothetical protein